MDQPAASNRRLVSRFLVIRFALVAVAVAICYLFEWRALRHLTLVANTWLDSLAGVHLQPISFDTVVWRGAQYQYVIACTMADVWCGSIPLLWSLRRSIWRNLATIFAFGLVLFAFNVVRLSFSDVLFAAGLSWNLAHNVVSGISYFLIWEFLRKFAPAFKESAPAAQQPATALTQT